MKRFNFTIDEMKDMDIVEMLNSVPKPLRGMYLKDALRLGIDREKDKDICEGLPDLGKPYCRYGIVRDALRHFIRLQEQTQREVKGELPAFDED